MVLRQKYNRITANIIVFSKTRNEVNWVIGSPSKLSGSRLLSALRSALLSRGYKCCMHFLWLLGQILTNSGAEDNT